MTLDDLLCAKELTLSDGDEVLNYYEYDRSFQFEIIIYVNFGEIYMENIDNFGRVLSK